MPNLDLLALGAHPDDVEFSCGGWLALAASRGQRVGIVDLTRGELATNGTPEIRAKEATAAAKVLGVERWNLALPDGALDDTNPVHVAAVVASLRTHRPRLLLAPWTRSRHPDHAATGRLAERAYFFAGVVNYRPDLGAPHRPDRVVYYPQRKELAPSFVVDVSAAYEKKTAAIACHASQIGTGKATLINRPLAIDAFSVRDRYWGATIGVVHGEPYLIEGPLPVADPIAHFAAHPAPPVLIA